MKHGLNTTSFRLSRVYAQGWNAARGPESVPQANPYAAEPERARWQAGFADAQRGPARKTR
jgi:hypothetical protein